MDEIPDSKELIIAGGPNGAGKTTFALEYCAERKLAYFGADQIAKEMSPEDPAKSQVAAGREFLRRIEAQLALAESCVIETTLSGRSFARYLQRAKEAGFEITVLFVFVDSADTCVARVKERVRKGGHDVPEADIRRRFGRSLGNFWRIYRPIADRWELVYNSTDGYEIVAVGRNDNTHIQNEPGYVLYQQLIGATNG